MDLSYLCVKNCSNEFKVQCEPLKHRFLDFTQVAFWAEQEAENEFALPVEQLELRLLDLTQVTRSMGRKCVQSGWERLKHCFIKFIKVLFWDVQDSENEFKVPLDHLKHHFIDLTRVAIWPDQEAKN